MEEEEFNVALEKLWIHGGALVSPDEKVQKGHDKWRRPYNQQRDHRLAQIDEISRFASSFSCRMLYLVKHFGDREDRGNECGICDFCAPENSSQNMPRNPNKQEVFIIREVISMLRTVESLSTGMLFKDACPGSTFPRSDFENLLKSLVKTGHLTVSEHAFEKEGKLIHYKRAELTKRGRSFNPNDCDSLEIIPYQSGLKKKAKVRTKRRKKAEGNITRKTVSGGEEHPVLYETIREWRLRKAKKKGIPAFRIFGNKVLDNLTLDLPTSMDELLMVNGVGPSFVKKYGKEILRMVMEYQKSKKR